MRFFLLIILVCALLSPVSLQAREEKPLYVSLWAEYLPGWVWQQFYDESKIRVIPRFYAQRLMGYEQVLKNMPHNDLALSCLEHAQYLEQQDKVLPIDYQRLRNWHNLKLAELPGEFRQNFSHCLPFDWHLLGLVVNSQQVDPARLSSFDALWDKDIATRLYLPEEPRILASLGLLALGVSSNSADDGHIALAKEKMEELLPLTDGVSDYGMVDAIARGSTGVGLIWNGMSTNLKFTGLPNMKFVLPEGRAVLLVEGWVIPKQATNIDGVYAFLDFLMRPDVAERLAAEYGYPTINNKAQLPECIKDNLLYNPPLKLVREAELESSVPLIDERFKDLCRPRD